MKTALRLIDMLRDSWWIAEKEFRQLLYRLPVVRLLVILLVPVVVLTVFGFRTGAVSAQHLPVAMVDLDHSGFSATLTTQLNSGNLNIINVQNLTDAQDLLRNGRTFAAIVIPQGFSRNITLHQQASVDLILDDSNPFYARAIDDVVGASVGSIAGSMSPVPVTYNISFLYGAGFGLVDYIVPGIVAMAAMFGSSFQCMSLIWDRALGTFDRVRAAPISPASVLMGYVITGSVMGLFQAVGILVFSYFVFQALVLNVGAVILVVLLVAFVFTGIGVIIVGLAKEPREAMMAMQITNAANVLLSSVFFPVELLPAPLSIVGSVLPLSFGVDLLRVTMIKGFSLFAPQSTSDLAILALYAAVSFGLASSILYKILSR
ncbi:MAG TPA: ABC transporter permease [Candidatus Dormibacteraeota bacterium]|nr:ABC transporter permease [Candidatus Dormibacteraeota bacterium]